VISSFREFFLCEVAISKRNIDLLFKKYYQLDTPEAGTDVEAMPQVKSNITQVINKFNKVTPKLKNKDIFAYKDIDDLNRVIFNAEREVSKRQIDVQVKKDSKKIYEDDNWLVIRPMSHAASCKYGSGSKWCTAMKDTSEHWSSYTQKGIHFYYIINKQPAAGYSAGGFRDEKFALAAQPQIDPDQWEAFDSEDTGMDINTLWWEIDAISGSVHKSSSGIFAAIEKDLEVAPMAAFLEKLKPGIETFKKGKESGFTKAEFEKVAGGDNRTTDEFLVDLAADWGDTFMRHSGLIYTDDRSKWKINPKDFDQRLIRMSDKIFLEVPFSLHTLRYAITVKEGNWPEWEARFYEMVRKVTVEDIATPWLHSDEAAFHDTQSKFIALLAHIDLFSRYFRMHGGYPDVPSHTDPSMTVKRVNGRNFIRWLVFDADLHKYISPFRAITTFMNPEAEWAKKRKPDLKIQYRNPKDTPKEMPWKHLQI